MHRDIKPENIVLRKSNNITDIILVDFGLATKSDIPKFIFTRCGTPGFVAPEIANLKNSNSKYSTICDVYSLGVLFHILLLNKSPFNQNDINQLLK